MKVTNDWPSKPEITEQIGADGGLDESDISAAVSAGRGAVGGGSAGGGQGEMRPRGVVESQQDKPADAGQGQ